MAFPDSGSPAAIGYSKESGVPYGVGLIKINISAERLFSRPNACVKEGWPLLQSAQRSHCRKACHYHRRLDCQRHYVTKTRQALRHAGAKEVHLLVASPPVISGCYFGIDTPLKKHLIAANMSLEEITVAIGADSVAYISLEGLIEAMGTKEDVFCTACFDEMYPMEIPHNTLENKMEEITYKSSGVDKESGYEVVERIKKHAKETFSPNVLSSLGSFGAFYKLSTGYKTPVLVSGTDGVVDKAEGSNHGRQA